MAHIAQHVMPNKAWGVPLTSQPLRSRQSHAEDMAVMQNIARILQDHVSRPYLHYPSQQPWQKQPELPSSQEILEPVEPSELPRNDISGPYDSNLEYIGIQYQLLRFDAIAPIIETVREYRQAPNLDDTQNTCIYTHVHIKGITYNHLGAAARISFSTERAGKRIRWEQSKRLQQGTIVALSPVKDQFKTICRMAVVAARSLVEVTQNPPEIDLFWASPDDAEIDPNEEFVMLEAKSGYIEASRHMLVAMQKLVHEKFALADYLVNVRSQIGAPGFIVRQPYMNLSALSPGVFARSETYIDNIENVDVLDEWPPIEGSSLDSSQMQAVERILTRKIAIIQGPPGTGKTFVSVTALKTMLQNWRPGTPPIVVSAQTNHALDQILTHILQFEDNVIRLGGRSNEENEDIRRRTIFNMRRNQPKSPFDSGLHRAKKELERFAGEKMRIQLDNIVHQGPEEAQRFFELGLITAQQLESLQYSSWGDPKIGPLESWLGDYKAPPRKTPVVDAFSEVEDDDFEELTEQEQEARKAKDDDEDADCLHGPYYPYARRYVGAGRGCTLNLIRTLLQSKSNLNDIPAQVRGPVYEYLKGRAAEVYRENYQTYLAQYNQLAEKVKILKWQSDVSLIKSAGTRLIGCTTTGLSKYRGLIASLSPRTLLIDEAAETLEGTVLAGMMDSIEQLILVGDHLQLQAHCNTTWLHKEPFNLAVSLFERLVSNNLEYTTLNCQRRMRTNLRELLSPFYPSLKDHTMILEKRNQERVKGMGDNNSLLFFHDWAETRDDALSYVNRREGDIIASFVNYLALNGTDISKITILTFYNGQRRYLRNALRRIPNLKSVGSLNVFTVDSYQGEENDIIILSLVRSNPFGKIGFLENRNRAVVALSRARIGLYIFGDILTLLCNDRTESFELWDSVKGKLRDTDRIPAKDGGPESSYISYLPIICEKHKKEMQIFDAQDLEGRGGCDERCDGELSCGHKCDFTCHNFSHDSIVCKQECQKTIYDCPHGHKCVMRCSDRCQCVCGPLKGRKRTQHTAYNTSQSTQVEDEFATKTAKLAPGPRQPHAAPTAQLSEDAARSRISANDVSNTASHISAPPVLEQRATHFATHVSNTSTVYPGCNTNVASYPGCGGLCGGGMHQFRAQYPPHFTSMVPYYISPSACLNCASMYPAVSYPGPLHDYMPASNSIPAVGANSLSHISLPPTKNIPATGAFSIPPVGQPSPASPPSLEQATGLAVPKSTTPPSQPLPMKYTAQSSSREAFTRGNKIMPTVKLHVNGLSNDDTEKDLEELFSPHCTVLGMSAAKHHLGYRMGSVVVPGHEADGAIFALNGIKRGGLKLKVERWSDELEKKGFLKRNGAPKTSAIPPKENQKEVQNGAKAAQSAPAAPKAFVPKPEHGWANFAQKAQEVFGTNGTGTRSPCSSGRSSPVLPIPKVRKNAGVLGAPTAPLSMRLQAQAESVITGLSQQSKSGSPGAPPKLSRAQKKRLKKLELESSNNDFAGLTAKFSSMSVSRQQSEQNQAAVAANTAVAAVPALHQPLQQPSPKLLPMQPTDLETLLAQRIESKTFLPKGVNDLVEISTFEGRSESSGSAAKARNRAETTQSEYLIDF